MSSKTKRTVTKGNSATIINVYYENYMYIFICLILFFSNLSFADNSSDPVIRHYQKGLEYYKVSLLDKARAEWKLALNINPEHKLSIDALNNLKVEIYISEGKLVSGRDNPFIASIREFYEKGMKYYRCEEYEKAIKEFEQGLNLNPIQPQVKIFYNKCKEKIAAVNFSKESQNKIVVNDKSGVVKSANQQISIKQTSRYKNKSSVLPKPQQAIKSQSSQTQIDELYIQGLKSYQQGKYEDAVNSWEQVLVLDPANEKAKKNLKTVKTKIGRVK